jgi:hypothetical protein
VAGARVGLVRAGLSLLMSTGGSYFVDARIGLVARVVGYKRSGRDRSVPGGPQRGGGTPTPDRAPRGHSTLRVMALNGDRPGSGYRR